MNYLTKAAVLIAAAFPLKSTRASRFSGLGLSFDASLGLPAEVFEHLPITIARPGSHLERTSERDVLTLGALTVCSGALPSVSGAYGFRRYSPNVLTAVFGEPGAGKGMVGVAARLIAPLNERLRREAELDISFLEAGGRPPSLMLPGNTSLAALYSQLQANKGHGILIETEIDALLSAMRNDWGDLGFVLRQAGENETISVARVKDKEAVFIPFPCLSCLLAGTPGQILRLLPTAEDGLFSRFNLLRVPHDSVWHSGRPTRSTEAFEAALNQSAAAVDSVHALLAARERPLSFDFTDDGWRLHDAVFTTLKAWGHSLHAGGPFNSLLHRRGVFAFRCAMISAAYRAFEQGNDLQTLDALTAQPADIEVGILLALHGLDHGVRLLDVLPGEPVLLTGKEQFMADVYEALDTIFHTSDLRAVLEGMDRKPRTAHNYLAEWRRLRTIVPKGKGMYEKRRHDPTDDRDNLNI